MTAQRSGFKISDFSFPAFKPDPAGRERDKLGQGGHEPQNQPVPSLAEVMLDGCRSRREKKPPCRNRPHYASNPVSRCLILGTTMIAIEIPGYRLFHFEHLVLDVNGTIAKDGHLLEDVAGLFAVLRSKLKIHLVTADTHGNQAAIDRALSLTAVRIPHQDQAEAKRKYIERLGADQVAAVGNGANDAAMLEKAGLGIFVVGPECSAVESLLKADVIAPDICAALELLIYPKRLIATLRR
jgi:soluble P-type ATPase